MKRGEFQALVEAELRPNVWAGQAEIHGFEHETDGGGHFYIWGGGVFWRPDHGEEVRVAEYDETSKGSLVRLEVPPGIDLHFLSKIHAAGDWPDVVSGWDEDPLSLEVR